MIVGCRLKSWQYFLERARDDYGSDADRDVSNVAAGPGFAFFGKLAAADVVCGPGGDCDGGAGDRCGGDRGDRGEGEQTCARDCGSAAYEGDAAAGFDADCHSRCDAEGKGHH